MEYGTMLMYLVSWARYEAPDAVARELPDVWRQVRRCNLPVQLAVAAAVKAATHAHCPQDAMLVGCAPCQAGSEDLFRWGRSASPVAGNVRFRDTRMNPVHTLHAVDNLALSSVAILLSNHAPCLGLGGAAGQSLCGLEAIGEAFSEERSSEALLFAGDQTGTNGTARGLGIALLCAREIPADLKSSVIGISSIVRGPRSSATDPQPHAAQGLADLLDWAYRRRTRSGSSRYEIPPTADDGMDTISIAVEAVSG